MDLKDKTALVFDRGSIFHSFAQALGGPNGMGQVLYFTEWRSFDPRSADAMVGVGMENLTRIQSFWDHVDEADVIVFPYIGDGDLQTYLRKKGHAVWGSGNAELLELDRAGFKTLLSGLGEPVADTDKIVGMESLKDYLQDPENDNRYLKASWFRGDVETKKHVNWKLSENWYYQLLVKLGPRGQEIEILSEEMIDGIEPGWDGYTVDGEFPKGLLGFESKNKGLAATWTRMPQTVQDSVEVMSDALRTFGARGNFHLEMRVTPDGAAYITDPCLRCGSPVSESMSKLISNWPEIVYNGANGVLVEPDYRAKWCAQIFLLSGWSDHNYMGIRVPEEVQGKIAFRRTMKQGDTFVAIPWTLDTTDGVVGSAIGMGDTLEDAIDEAIDAAEQVEAEDISFDRTVKDKLIELFAEEIP